MDKAAHGEVRCATRAEASRLLDLAPPKPKPYAGAKLTEDEEGYGYCTQFICA
jgi:hypothetical protein